MQVNAVRREPLDAGGCPQASSFFCASVGNNDNNKDCGMIVHS